MREIRILVTMALAALWMTGPALAIIEVDDFEDAPLYAATEDDARIILRYAFGENYDRLDGSEKFFRVAFETDQDIAEAADVPVARIRLLGAYLEKDVGIDDSFTIHVNKDWIQRDIQKGLEGAGDRFNTLPEEERNRRLILAYRLSAAQLIAHEGQHAVQVEEGEVGFGPNLTGPAIHEKIGHDRYDEHGGYFFQHGLRLRRDGQLSEENKRNLKKKAIEQVEKHYSFLRPNFFVVRFGQEAAGEAPFPWPSGTRSEQKSMQDFVSGLIDGGALGGTESGSRGVPSNSGSGGDELELLAGDKFLPPPRRPASVEGSEETTGEFDRLFGAEEEQLALGQLESQPMDRIIADVSSGGSTSDGGTAYAKRAAGAKRRDYGVDENALPSK